MRPQAIALVCAVMLLAALAPSVTVRGLTNSNFVQFSSDPSLTANANSVTSSQAFPDGSKTAQCLVLVDRLGTEARTFGDCAGITVNATCASLAFDASQSAPDHGAGLSINGAAEWVGVYDTGPNCTSLAGNANLTVQVSGTTAGQQLIFFWNNDNTKPTRDGCVGYNDGVSALQPACVRNASAGNNGTLYEVTTEATQGTAYEAEGTSNPGSSGNLTLGAVFIEAASALQATPTSTVPPLSTATPAPSPTPQQKPHATPTRPAPPTHKPSFRFTSLTLLDARGQRVSVAHTGTRLWIAATWQARYLHGRVPVTVRVRFTNPTTHKGLFAPSSATLDTGNGSHTYRASFLTPTESVRIVVRVTILERTLTRSALLRVR